MIMCRARIMSYDLLQSGVSRSGKERHLDRTLPHR